MIFTHAVTHLWCEVLATRTYGAVGSHEWDL